MPKIKTPKLIIRKDGRAVVHWKGKMHVMGRSGTREAQTAYHRFCIEIAENPLAFTILSEIADATIEELCARYVEFAAGRMHPANFLHCKIIISDFLLYLYGDFQVNLFTPRCLKRVQFAMVQSRRFCRRQINDHVKRIVAMFRWGAEEDMVEGSTWHALKAVKALRAGEHGTFDHAERLPVPDDVVVLTLRYLPPVVSAMVQIQGMTGMRPSELCGMRVGDIAQSGDVWQYRPKNHKTEAYIGKKTVHLGKAEQELLAPYLIGKKPESAVFSPAQAMKERNVEKRANRQSKITPSQAARDAQRAKKPIQYAEFYDANSYRKAIEYAIKAAKRDGVFIPHWTPYQLRHGAGTRAEQEYGLDGAQALLAHTSAQMTKRYAHGRDMITENMAKNRRNPFAEKEENS